MKQLLGAWVFVVVLMGCVQIAIRRDLSISREAPNAGLDDSSISVARAGVAVRELPYVQNIPLAGWGAYLWFHFRPASSNDAPNRHLKTRVLVLEDPQHQKVALITTDLHGGSRYITEYVAKRLSGRGFHAGNIFLSFRASAASRSVSPQTLSGAGN